MKKLMIVLAALCLGASAQADVGWSWWMEDSSSVDLSFGIASKRSKVNAFELTLLYGGSEIESGVQWSFLGINDSDRANVLQLAPWFNRGNDACVQLGLIDVSGSSVFQMGVVTVSDRSKVQIGFLNFNKNGFLPVFPFINLDKSLFE